MELIKNNVRFCDLILDRTSVYEESTDAIVSDTFPDIARIACAVGDVVVKDQSPQNDRVLVSGTVRASVLYQPEGGEGLRRLEVPLSFAHIEEGKGITPECTCFVRCEVLGVDARAVNSRKVSVTARLCFETNAFSPRELMLTEEVDGGELPLEILQETHTLRAPVYAACRDFTVLDDIDVTDCAGDTVVGADCTLRLNERRAMHGKAVLKGDVLLHCLLLRPDSSLHTLEQMVPFTQIIDFDGAEEEQDLRVRFAVTHLDLELHETGTLSIGVGVSTLLCVEGEQTLQTIRDIYQTTHPLHVQVQPVHILGLCDGGEFHAEANETVPLGVHCSQLLDAHAMCSNIQRESPDALRLTVQVRLLFLDDSSAVHHTLRTVGVSVPLEQGSGNMTASDLAVQVTCVPNGEDSMGVRMLFNGRLVERGDCTVNDVTAVEAGEPEGERSTVTLVLRFVRDEESLWDIAKSYRTTMRAIRTANDISGDTERVRDQMLLIPICEK